MLGLIDDLDLSSALKVSGEVDVDGITKKIGEELERLEEKSDRDLAQSEITKAVGEVAHHAAERSQQN